MNLQVHVTGVPLKDAIKEGLPHELERRMSYVQEPDDDTEYMERLTEVARTYENYLRDQGKTFKEETDSSHPKKKDKKRGNLKGNTDPLKPDNSNNKVEKKGSKDGSTQGKKRLHESKEEALKGVAQALIDERIEEKLCTRCGKKGHRWYFCRGDIVTTSTRKIAGQKRGRDAKAAEDGDTAKKAKVAARTQAGGSSGSSSWQGRIYEIDSEEEVD
jgi:hypothetical protein